ncbi:hypothetical protein GGX14DRAFT_397904 [Mycena pura]|uniref:Plastocyanin-like domain-containing protein n=1 Tax=Mycena pura TaxID=153505 RepID=A0AAD6VBB3_9AGAR|nr:hypothetical protein GGX14DRAFT_397904 [Mycena pura]
MLQAHKVSQTPRRVHDSANAQMAFKRHESFSQLLLVFQGLPLAYGVSTGIARGWAVFRAFGHFQLIEKGPSSGSSFLTCRDIPALQPRRAYPPRATYTDCAGILELNANKPVNNYWICAPMTAHGSSAVLRTVPLLTSPPLGIWRSGQRECKGDSVGAPIQDPTSSAFEAIAAAPLAKGPGGGGGGGGGKAGPLKEIQLATLINPGAPVDDAPADHSIDLKPRRDVVAVEKGGVVICFHADNPGPWFLHWRLVSGQYLVLETLVKHYFKRPTFRGSGEAGSSRQ